MDPPRGTPPLAAGELVRFVALNAALEAGIEDPARRAALTSIAEAAAALVPRGAAELAARLPRHVGEAMGPFGWLWNGFYVPRGPDELHLAHAHGPPVCSPLVRSGGPLTSGMCFDALALNQTLGAFDAKRWPGYVSCDAASGLATLAGIACPIRDPAGRPHAVWDLDATQPIVPGDVRFADVLFSTLARCVAFRPSDFEPR